MKGSARGAPTSFMSLRTVFQAAQIHNAGIYKLLEGPTISI
jgi:hypothetical protein